MKLSLSEARQLQTHINSCEDPQYQAGSPEKRCGGEIPGTRPDYFVIPIIRRWWPGKTIYIQDAESFALLAEQDMQNPAPQD